MTAGREPLAHYLRRLATEPAKETPDAALLGRFISEGDGAAFAALVERHGPLVLAVCRRILDDAHDAEDAFQAAFLVLARRATTVYPREALAAWLHGVARRVALKTRCARARQSRAGRHLPPSPVDPHPDPLAELSVRELLCLVDDEVRQLPEVYRLPVILCCLEGRSLEEAARLLGWTPYSVKGRLQRGRARLHQRLARRGLSLSAALTTAELARGASSAAVVARLVAPTVQAALRFAAGQGTGGAASAQAAARASEVATGMALGRLKVPAALLLLACLLAAGFAAHRLLAPSEAPAQAATSASAAREERATAADEDSQPIEVSGCVLDPAGQPFAGGRLYVGYAPRRSEPDSTAHRPAYPVRATSGALGRFQFVFTRSELDERYLDASRPVVVAVAEGFGLDWAEIGGPAENAALTLRLTDDVPVRGRVLGPDRKPLAGARVVVRQLREGPRSCRGPLPGQPRQVLTDADGRFRLTGVGRSRVATLALEGAGLSQAEFVAAASPTGAGPEFVVATPQSVRGMVRDKATGRPVAGVRMSLHTPGPTTLSYAPGTLTDAQGRYQLFGRPNDRRPRVIVAQPQPGQPYFAASMPWQVKPGGTLSRWDFELVGGIPLRGRVTNAATGTPPKRAVVEYYPLYPNPHSSELTSGTKRMPASSAPMRRDGSYSLTVLPGPGAVLVVASPRDSYAVAVLEDRELASAFNDGADHRVRTWNDSSWIDVAVMGRPSPRCIDRFNALALINPARKTTSLAVDLTVHPARRLRGTVVDPDGNPLGGVRVVGLTSMPDTEVLPGSSFTVEGLNPRRPRQLIFEHREKGLGKVVTVRAEAGPLTVRLEPCGVVAGRVVDREGKPVPGERVYFSPGKVKGLDRTDDAGRFRVELVAGRQYTLMLRRKRWSLEIEPGRTRDLRDLLLEDRPAGQRRAPGEN
jgi:RNA polymerase sigma factor (sigma-70 family)